VRIVLDTNVLVSGIFFGGLPGRLLDAWADGRLELVLSPAILDEYLRVCERIAESRPALEYESILAAIAGHGILVADKTWDVQPTPSWYPGTPISWTSPAGRKCWS
jgi:predicted nucleic acid-binding protein